MLAKLLFLSLCNAAVCLREETGLRADIGNNLGTQANDTEARVLLSGWLGTKRTQGFGDSMPVGDSSERITACMQGKHTEVQYPKNGDGTYDPTMIWPKFGGSEFGGTINYQRFVDVVAQMKQVPDWERGAEPTIVRGNDLGMCALYEQLWRVPDNTYGDIPIARTTPRFPYRTIFLGAPVDVHEYVRPILDRVLGAHLGENLAPWTEAEILQDVQDFFNSRDRINTASRQDVPHFMTKLLHKVHLGIGFDHDFWTVSTPEEFTDWQNTFLMHAVLGGHYIGPVGTSFAMTQKRDYTIVKMRTNIVKAYMTLINQDTRTGKDGNPLFPEELTRQDLSAEEWMEGGKLYNVAAGMFDSLVFAGGLSVVQGIEAAMALLNTNTPYFAMEDRAKNLQEADVEAFVYELYRLIPQVVGFPWWDYKQGYTGNQLHGGAGSGHSSTFLYGQRYIMQMATALRDPEAWGPDAFTFKIRDLDATLDVNDDQITPELREKHPELTVEGLDLTTRGAYGLAWVEQTNEYPYSGKDAKVPGPMSRGCPGQALSIAITKAWIATYVQQRDQWEVESLIDGKGNSYTGELQMVDTAPFHMQSVVIAKKK